MRMSGHSEGNNIYDFDNSIRSTGTRRESSNWPHTASLLELGWAMVFDPCFRAPLPAT
jgi:hypothetical protein